LRLCKKFLQGKYKNHRAKIPGGKTVRESRHAREETMGPSPGATWGTKRLVMKKNRGLTESR